jgi:outer membrane protein assembly factor BamB
MAAEPDDAGKPVAPITLLTDPRTGNQLAAAADYMASEDWKEAVRLLQHVLDGKEDVVVHRKAGGTALVSAQAEARRLLAGMAPPGREVYEKTYGPMAAGLLKQGRKLHDREVLAQVVRRYLYTAAGPEALQELAREEFRAGEWAAAARNYETLLKHRGVARWAAEDLYQAAVAARRANREAADEGITRELLARAGAEGVRIGERTLSREQLQKDLERAPAAAPAVGEWPVYRGNAARQNQGDGGPALLDPRWKQPMVYLDHSGPTAEMLGKAERHLKSRGQLVLPSYFPITATATRGERRIPLVIFKNYWGVQAVGVQTGKLEWNSPSSWSLERMLPRNSDPRKVQAINNWLQFYVEQNQRPAVLFENSTVGTLSTDNQFVYAVEDFAVPPLRPNLPGFGAPGPGGVPYGGELNDAIHHSRLQAFMLPANGKLAWEVGAIGEKDNPLSDCFFLGPPLPLRGLLYVLTQKNKDLRLVCIDPQAGGKVVSVLSLAQTPGALSEDPARRTQAVHLAYADGILVVPTNAGAVLGINLQENSLAWAYIYREREDPRTLPDPEFRRRLPPGWVWGPDGRPFNPNPPQAHWKVTAPAIQDGKVVVAAPDARELHCLNLRDGSLVWKKSRGEDDLYFAGSYSGKVVIVGKKRTRSLSLATGETLWELDTGVPSGQGIASGNVYYLPLLESAQSKEPEICAIDVNKGFIVARTRSRTREVPGNLLFYEGNVVSQTAHEVVAYPQLKVKIAQMNELLKKNANDPTGLSERGGLRLDQGDILGAVADLRNALRNKPPAEVRARAREKLYEALTELLQRDFKAGEEYLKEYEALGKVEVDPAANEDERAQAGREERKRRSQFLFLVARARELQGKLVDALTAYLDLAAQGSEQLVPSPDEPAVKVRLDVWARRRIDELLKKANPEQRKQLEEEIERRRKKAEGDKNSADLRTFVAVFGPWSEGGRAARLSLAGRLIEGPKAGDREAEVLLEEVRRWHEDPARAARATEMLAQLSARRGLLEDAVAYYRILARDFARVALPDGRTGQEVWDALATDKRFLPFLEERRFSWGKLKVVLEPGSPLLTPVYHFEPSGESLPFFRQHTLGLNLSRHNLELVDRRNSETLWRPKLTQTMLFQAIVQNHGQPYAARFSYRTLSHLVVLPVGNMAFGIDPVNKQVLWEQDLAGSSPVPGPGQPGPTWTNLTVDPRDGSIHILYADGWSQRLGRSLVMRPSALCMQTRDGLQGTDPLTGRTRWKRADVSSHSDLFGDEEVACVAEMSAEGKPTSTRVLRLADGGTVKAPDFAALYDKRLHTNGRRLLLSESGKDGVTLRLYDVLAGKDLWAKTFAPGSIVLNSEDPRLAGVVGPDGKARVIDVTTQNDVLSTDKGYDERNPNTGMDPAHLDKLQGITLLADDRQLYLACNGPADPSLARFGGVQSNLHPGLGMRCIPINGRVYTYDRQTGAYRWQAAVFNQMIVLDHFRELPIVLFTSRYTKVLTTAGRANVTQVAEVLSVDKNTGKFLYNNKDLNITPSFHALKIDARAGRIEFVSFNLTIVHQIGDAPARPSP